MKVYLARESKISRLLELEANVGEIEPSKLALGSTDHRMKAARTKSLNDSQRGEQAVRSASQTTIYWISAPWKMKELPLRKNAQVDAISRQKSKGKPDNIVSIDI